MAEGNKVFEIVTDYLHIKCARSSGSSEFHFWEDGPGVMGHKSSLQAGLQGSSGQLRRSSVLSCAANVIKRRKLWEYANCGIALRRFMGYYINFISFRSCFRGLGYSGLSDGRTQAWECVSIRVYQHFLSIIFRNTSFFFS